MLGALATFVPLMLIFALANLGQKQKDAGDSTSGFAVMAMLMTAFVNIMLMVAGIAFLAFGTLLQSQPSFLTAADSPLLGSANPTTLAWGLLAPGAIGLILLLPAVRRFAARHIPIEADNVVHAVALSLSMLVVVNMALTLGVGLEQFSEMIVEAQEETGESLTSISGIWLQQLLMALLAFIGVGWVTRLSLKETLVRLGLVMPTGRQVLIGVGLAFVMVLVVLTIEAIGAAVGLGPNVDVEELTQELLGPLLESPWGILTLGLAAAVGEETLMRGAAQPRFGLLLTALLFALLHSNYGITLATGVVFLLGIVLGIVRNRHNTTTSMVLHATYNIILGSLAYFGASLLGK
jgi:hypothetical protein